MAYRLFPFVALMMLTALAPCLLTKVGWRGFTSKGAISTPVRRGCASGGSAPGLARS